MPEGSLFCNKCGTRIITEIECPACHEMIPATSVFCPKCGKLVQNEFGPKANGGANGEPVKPNAEQQAADNKSHKQRNIIIAVVAFIVILLIFTKCFFNGNGDHDSSDADSTATTAMTADNAENIFNSALQSNNFTGDGAMAAYAIPVAGSSDSIVGITFLSNPQSHSFFKIYTVTSKDGGNTWDIKNNVTRYVNNRAISFDTGSLMSEPGQIPQSVKVDGKDYIFFAYLNMPASTGEGAVGRVSLCLYNVSTQNLVTVNYDGPIKTRDDGHQYIYGKAVDADKSAESHYLQGQAASIGIIYVPTQEELDAEAKAQEEKDLSGPDKAIDKWANDNSDHLSSLASGETVTMSTPTYDKPIFNINEASKKRTNDRYIAILDNKGNVLGFNKSSRKYFVIYAGDSKATDIGFASSDNEETTLNIKTSAGRITYDLAADRAKMEK
jgi:hypothetical protein